MFDVHKVDELLSKYSRTKKQQKAFEKRVSDRQQLFKRIADKQPVNFILK